MTNNAAEIVSRTSTSVTVKVYANHTTGPEAGDAPFYMAVYGQFSHTPAPPGYSASAVAFDGSTWLWRNNTLSASNTSSGVMSVWIEETSVNGFGLTGHQGLTVPHFNIAVQGATSPQKLQYVSIATGSAPSLQFHPPLQTFSGSWKNILISWDVGFPAPNRLRTVAINDSLQALTTDLDLGIAYPIQYQSMVSWAVGAIGISGGVQLPFTGYMADFQYYIGQYLDLSVTANRRLFIDDDGKPVDPATAAVTLGTPLLLFSGTSASFGTNQGTGGAFTTVGAFTDAPTSPSD